MINGHTYYDKAIGAVGRDTSMLITNITYQLERNNPGHIQQQDSFEQRQINNTLRTSCLPAQTEDFYLLREFNNGLVTAKELAHYIVEKNIREQ